MPLCVIAQPIHPIGTQILEAAGIEVVQAAGAGPSALDAAWRAANAVIVRDAFSAAMIDAAPRLMVIGNHGTGFDKVDVDHAASAGVPVVYTPEANVQSVAEHALMLMLAVARRAPQADAAVRNGEWRFKFHEPMHSLYGKTLGIVGFGRTGQILGRMAQHGFGMKVVVWSPSAGDGEIVASGAAAARTLEELLDVADVVSLHRPLRPDTRHTIGAAQIARMKPGAILINTSRGGLVDEDALVRALRERRIFGAGLDVFETEPLPKSAAIASLANVVLTPHAAGSTQEALLATASQCAEQVVAVLRGQKPSHLARPEAWHARRTAETNPL